MAVYDFKGAANDGDFGTKVTALVTAELATNANLILLERAELNKALKEQAFGVSGMVSSDAAAKIGQITGVKVLVCGQVIKIGNDHRVIIADIIGTETGRLFAAKVEGAGEKVMEMTSEVSSKIAEIIGAQATNLVAPTEESHDQRLNRIVESIKGTNRPSVSVAITYYAENGGRWHDNWAEYEFGVVLLKAGFTVIDENSDRKADIDITGDSSGGGTKRGELLSSHMSLEVKIRERRTGKIVGFDRQTGTASGIGEGIVGRVAHVNAVDGLAERVLPLLAK